MRQGGIPAVRRSGNGRAPGCAAIARAHYPGKGIALYHSPASEKDEARVCSVYVHYVFLPSLRLTNVRCFRVRPRSAAVDGLEDPYIKLRRCLAVGNGGVESVAVDVVRVNADINAADAGACGNSWTSIRKGHGASGCIGGLVDAIGIGPTGGGAETAAKCGVGNVADCEAYKCGHLPGENIGPVQTAISRTIDSCRVSARENLHACKDEICVRRIHRQVADAGAPTRKETVAKGADKRICTAREWRGAYGHPALAPVGGFQNASAIVNIKPGQSLFARAGINGCGGGGSKSNRAHSQRRICVAYSRPRGAAVGRTPDASLRAADQDGLTGGNGRVYGDRRDATCHGTKKAAACRCGADGLPRRASRGGRKGEDSSGEPAIGL